ILVRVIVGERPGSARGAKHIQAEVEYALSSTLSNVDAFQKRVVNLLANESDDGTHTLAIVGGSLKTTFDFGDGEMRTSVGAARDELSKIAADARSDPPKYRFDGVTNGTTLARLESDIVPLAELGYQLYSNIVTGKDPAFAKELRKALGSPGATIQVAAVKSARYVFPWALVYDQNIVSGTLRLCPQFKSDAAKAAGEWLTDQVCLTRGCP